MSERIPEKVMVTGSTGLVGSEAVEYYAAKGATVFGIDNNMREVLFGKDGSTDWKKGELVQKLNGQYIHIDADIRDEREMKKAFLKSGEVDLVVHCASQPAHDWAAKNPRMDFAINAGGTLNMLETYRQMSPDAAFIHCSTSKVYGDNPNRLPLVEGNTRYDLPESHPYYWGITEDFPIDHALHSLFGASKVSADIVAQEYGKYFDLPVAIFRPVCISGKNHSGAELHGFLSYLAKCIATGREYNIYGYKGKQVRGNIHSFDLVQAFDQYYQNPHTRGQAYNIDGGRVGSVSILEAGQRFSQLLDKPFKFNYVDENRIGDHIWAIFSNNKFQKDFPNWQPTYDAEKIMEDIAKGGHFK
jgi:CDP-paratose 2-epimerase